MVDDVLRNALKLLGEQRYTEAEGLLQRVVEVDPHHQVAWDRLGWALANQGRFDEAIRCVERAIAEASTKRGPGGRKYDLFRFYTTLGATHCLAGEPEEALAALQSGDPSNWFNTYWKARALRLLGRVQEALSMAREAEGRAPKPLLPPLGDEVRGLIAECEKLLGH